MNLNYILYTFHVSAFEIGKVEVEKVNPKKNNIDSKHVLKISSTEFLVLASSFFSCSFYIFDIFRPIS